MLFLELPAVAARVGTLSGVRSSMKNATATLFLGLAAALPFTLALNNGLARTPILGFNTWNYFACDSECEVLAKRATLSAAYATA